MHHDIVKKLKQEALPLFAISSAVFLVSIALKYVLVPQCTQLLTRQNELSKYQMLISSESGYSQIKQEIEEKIDLLKGKVNSFSSVSTDSRDLSSFLETLISKARASDIRFVKMQPQAETKTAEHILFPVILDMTTTYHALGQFVSSLEKLPHLFRIDRLAMECKNEGNMEVKILVTCFIPLQEDL